MRRLLNDVFRTLWPRGEELHGPLPPLLLVLTVATGLVDAVSYLALGHVFVANMTGNVVFLGFALAGDSDLSAPASLVAIAAFLLGAVGGGRLGARFAGHRARLLAAATAVETALTAATVVVAAVLDETLTPGVRYTLIVGLALAMGLQNAVVRRLGVPDLTTTVMTRTLTGLAADSPAAGGAAPNPGRRVLSVAALFLGALLGAALVLGGGLVPSLALPLVVLAATTAAAFRYRTVDAPWVRPKP
ncbi:YoaK family protein [Streptomyces sp. NPDC002734]|uniref:YoaK family protein n=1 Tax=Streptomyces sp. NPDC002734 TaxID=3154426 RepID=UPI003323C190